MTDVKGLPEVFLKEMQELLGAEYERYIDSFRQEWRPGLRVNTLKISPERLKEMVPWILEPVEWTDNGFYYGGGADPRPSKHPLYYAGLYYLQEPSAMAPAAMLPVAPGEKVLDLCAAPGGKSTELAARLQGEGLLVSNDISYSRARALLKNLELAGAANICVTSECAEKLAQVWPGFFDKILVDAPCSGEGMFRREESMVKSWMEKGPEYYGPLQRQILDSAVNMLKPGGMLLYSTCTFSRYEDEGAVQYILDKYPELVVEDLDLKKAPGASGGAGLSGCMRLFPHRLQGEGHFLALLRRRGQGVTPDNVKAEKISPKAYDKIRPDKGRQRAAVEKQEDLRKFLADIDMDLDLERVVTVQDHVYYLPKGITENLPLRFLRTGLLLGELKKGRFEPSQALAMALRPGQYPCVLRLGVGDERVIRYLKGETVSLREDEVSLRGWSLVTIEDFPLAGPRGLG